MNPTCPQCGQQMAGGAPHGDWAVQYECRRCGVYTQGEPVRAAALRTAADADDRAAEGLALALDALFEIAADPAVPGPARSRAGLCWARVTFGEPIAAGAAADV